MWWSVLFFFTLSHVASPLYIKEDIINNNSLDTLEKNLYVRKVMFGSCCNEQKPQPFWEMLKEQHPDVWLWLGDVVYSQCRTLKCLQNSYATMKSNEKYRKFILSVPFYDGTWDDHDYGINDAGKNLPFKNASQIEFLNFLKKDSIQRIQRQGVYSSHLFPIFSSDHTRGYLKIIILDTRFSRDQPLLLHRLGTYDFPLSNKLAALLRLLTWSFHFSVDHAGNILDNQQWEWLERQFREKQFDDTPVVMTLLLSSIQVLSGSPIFESWYWYPKNKQRLIKLIKATRPPALHILSGDVHFGQFLGSMNCVPEITTSGMTHSVSDHKFLGYFVMEKILPLFLTPFFLSNNSSSFYKDQLMQRKNYGLINLELKQEALNLVGNVLALDSAEKIAFHRFLPLKSIQNQSYECLDEKPIYSLSNPFALMSFQVLLLILILLPGFTCLCVMFKVGKLFESLLTPKISKHRSFKTQESQYNSPKMD